MSDFEDLIAAFDSGRLLRPPQESLNIVDLSRALAVLGGATGIETTPGSEEIAGMIGPSDHLVFILADGLGMSLLDAVDSGSFLKRHLAAELLTVFPSSSATAITSLATGQWPSAHGITGRWTYFPEAATVGEVLPYVVRGDGRPLSGAGLATERAFPAAPLLPKMKRDVMSFFPSGLLDSVYSDYFTGGTPKQGYQSISVAIDQVADRVNSRVNSRVNASDAPSYTYLYTPRIDSAAHEFGASQAQVQGAIRGLDRDLTRLMGLLDGPARVVVSADHGLLDAPRALRRRIRNNGDLNGNLRAAPSGDARAIYFHTREDAVSQVQEYLRAQLGEHFLIITADEAVELELLGPGPMSPETRERIGDLVAISRGAGVAEYRTDGRPGLVGLNVSHHSGLTPEEMRVPLVIA